MEINESVRQLIERIDNCRMMIENAREALASAEAEPDELYPDEYVPAETGKQTGGDFRHVLRSFGTR